MRELYDLMVDEPGPGFPISAIEKLPPLSHNGITEITWKCLGPLYPSFWSIFKAWITRKPKPQTLYRYGIKFSYMPAQGYFVPIPTPAPPPEQK